MEFKIKITGIGTKEDIVKVLERALVEIKDNDEVQFETGTYPKEMKVKFKEEHPFNGDI
jgi:hypothetical protein